jgi:chromosome segregation ATPase
MGAKKRVAEQSLSPPKKAVTTKKARVSEPPATPESIALLKLVAAFDNEIGTMLPDSVVNMVKSVADKCLMTPVENRDELESTFAKVVGEAVQTGLEGLKKAHKDSIEAVAEEEEKVKGLDAVLAEANTLKDQADKALDEAQEAQKEASGKKSDAETELETHIEEEDGLQPKKKLMESDLSALKEVQTTVRGPTSAGKTFQKAVVKLQKALTEVEAPQSLIAGIGEAIGKQSSFDQHFVGEASKLLYTKSEQIEAELAKFEETVKEAAEKTVTLRAKVEQLSSDLNERDTELVAATKKQTDCIAAIKESEKQKKLGDKSLEKAITFKDEKAAAEAVGTDAETQYTFLIERTAAVPVEEAPEAPMEAQVEVEAA